MEKKEKEFSDVVKVKIIGRIGLLTDRFITMSSDQIPPEQKLYLNEKNECVFPAINLMSFFYGDKPGGCAKRFEGKEGKKYQAVGLAYTQIEPEIIPILRNGKPITFKKFINGYDEDAKIRVLEHKALIQKGKLIIPSPKIRPMIESPWEMNFSITVFKNALMDRQKIKNWLVRGGIEIALGTFRPVFGRFMVEFKD